MNKSHYDFAILAVVFAGTLCVQPSLAMAHREDDDTLPTPALNQRTAPAQSNHAPKPPGHNPRENKAASPRENKATSPRESKTSSPRPTTTHKRPAVLSSTPPASPGEAVESVDVTPASADDAATGDDRSTWYGDAWPMFDRVIDAYTARTSRKGTFNTLIAHRNNGGFGRAPFDSLLGFDAGLLKVGLGVRYGIIDPLDVGILRMNGTYELFDTYEFDLRYQILRQEKLGLDVALRVGFSWFAQPGDYKDSAAPFVSLLIDRLLFNRAMVGFSLLYHQSSSGPFKNAADSSASLAIQLYTDVRITQGLSIALEYTQPVAGYHEVNPDITLGPRFITNRHTFAIVLSNTQYYDADGIITGNSCTSFRDWMLGFNITREL